MINSRISIIVPVYNVEKYISRCIDSIINQTYHNIEIILIDDGSTDNSGKICDQYSKQDYRIKVFHQENQGLSMARNKGINMATGEYIGFVDSDDWIENDMYETLYKNIIKYDANISTCKFICVEESGREYMLFEDEESIIPNRNTIQILENDDIIRYHLLDNEYRLEDAVWTKLFKKSFFDHIRFPKNKLYEDTFIIYLLLDNAKKIVVSYEIKYNYFIRSGSITNSPFSLKSFDIIEANIQRYNYIKYKYPNIEPLCRKVFLKTLIRTLFKMGNDSVTKLYNNEIEDIIQIIKKMDIYTCDLPNDRIKILELFRRDIREGFIGFKLYSNTVNM